MGLPPPSLGSKNLAICWRGFSWFFFSQGLWRSNCIKFSSLGREICPFFSEFHWTNPLLLKGSTREYFWDLSRGHFPITTHLNNWISQFLDFFWGFSIVFQSFKCLSKSGYAVYPIWLPLNGKEWNHTLQGFPIIFPETYLWIPVHSSLNLSFFVF